jgi:hypothetical protein
VPIGFPSWKIYLRGVVVLHETIHELKRKKQNDLILKLDFEKVYGKVNWNFLQQVLRMRGFPRLWCQWIEKVVTKASVCVQVNDDLGHFFQTGKGLRQGDPLSPILFNLVVDMLTVFFQSGGRYVDNVNRKGKKFRFP